MKGRAVQRVDLTQIEQDKMFLLLQRHFHGVERDVFDSDLCQKNWVVLFESEEVSLAGFSTILHYRTNYKGEDITVIYSGDTIMDQSAWSSFSLPRLWIKTIREISESDDTERVFWLLLTSGYRTYRFLPVFWKQYYPRHDRETPVEVKTLIDYLARKQFGIKFDQSSGIVTFDKPQSLRGDLLSIPTGKLKNPHVVHFNKLNPGHNRGDELVCLAELSDDNLSTAGRRMLASHQIK